MDIKLIALDLDGTLLDDRKNLSERNRNALARCIERGICIVPTTGRTVSGIPETVLSIPGVRYAITVNGGTVEDMQENKVIQQSLLSKELTLQVLERVKDYPVMYDAYIGGRGKAEKRFLENLDAYAIKPEIQALIRKTREEVPDLFAYVAECETGVDKVNLFFADMELRETVRQQLSEISGIMITSSMRNNLEINAAEATKGNGLMKLAEYLGLSREQTMAFGDGENDFSMIRSAYMGVAMKNASEALRAEADYVTLTNNEDGVADAIEKFVLAD